MADHGEPEDNPFDIGRMERARTVGAMFTGDPQPLRAGALPPFPADALPGPYAAMADGVAAALQVDTAMSGPMVLGALSAAVGGCAEAEVQSDWREVGVLHIVIAAGSSERKSPAFEMATGPLKAEQKRMADEIGPRRIEALARRRIAEKRAANAEAEASKLARGKDSDAALGVDPVAFAAKLAADAEATLVPEIPRLIVDDVTPEALNSRLAANRGRLAMMSTEGGMFETLAGRYSRGVANMDGWLKAYAGDTIIVDRLGRVGEVIDRPALTVLLTVQPDVLASVRADARFDGRGLLARLSIAQPRAMVGHRDPDAAVSLPETVSAAYAAELGHLARRLHERDGDPVAVKFSPAARGEITDMQRRVERRLLGGDLSGGMESWGGKHVGRVVRIALLCHMAEHGPEGTAAAISAETVGAAWRIGEFFAAHTRAVVGVDNTGGAKLGDLTATMEFLCRRDRAVPHSAITVREIGKSGPVVLRRKSTRDPVLETLADFNLIVRGKLGGAEVVHVHPDAAVSGGAELW